MGKRSERLSGKKLLSNLGSLQGKEAHIVLWEGVTYFGDLIKTDTNTITLKDKNAKWYNRKAHTHNLKLVDIREIIVDSSSKW